jgi:acyl-CoA thioesterase-1
MTNMSGPDTITGLRSVLASVWARSRGFRRHGLVGALALVLLTGAVTFNPSRPRVIVAFGDSYFSGYRLGPTESFPVQFENALRKRGHDARVVNEGVPGETIADGLARLDRTLAKKPDLIILELGANDAEQGLDPAISRENLDTMLAKIRAAHVKVLLCGALAPEDAGEEYQASFNPIYRDMAEKHRVPLYRFILDGVAKEASLKLDDGEHPNPQGVQVMVDRILPVVERALDKKHH